MGKIDISISSLDTSRFKNNSSSETTNDTNINPLSASVIYQPQIPSKWEVPEMVSKEIETSFLSPENLTSSVLSEHTGISVEIADFLSSYILTTDVDLYDPITEAVSNEIITKEGINDDISELFDIDPATLQQSMEDPEVYAILVEAVDEYLSKCPTSSFDSIIPEHLKQFRPDNSAITVKDLYKNDPEGYQNYIKKIIKKMAINNQIASNNALIAIYEDALKPSDLNSDLTDSGVPAPQPSYGGVIHSPQYYDELRGLISSLKAENRQLETTKTLLAYEDIPTSSEYQNFVANYSFDYQGVDWEWAHNHQWVFFSYDGQISGKRYTDGVSQNGTKAIDAIDPFTIVEYSLDNAKKGDIAAISMICNQVMKYYDFYSVMTEDEVMMYHYLFKSEGRASADSYLELLSETLNFRSGAIEAFEFIGELDLNDEGQLKTSLANLFGVSVEGLEDGLAMYVQGLSDARDSDKYTALDYKKMIVLLYLQEHSNYYDGAYSLTLSIGNMLMPMLVSAMASLVLTPAAGALTGPGAKAVAKLPKIAGNLAMYASVSGNAQHDALVNGASTSDAKLYGVLSGASETLLGYLLGRIPGLSANSGKILKDIFGEFFEEGLQVPIDGVFRELVLDENVDWSTIPDEMVKSAIMGAITSGIMNGPTTIAQVTVKGKNVAITLADLTAFKEKNSELSTIEAFKQLYAQKTGKISVPTETSDAEDPSKLKVKTEPESSKDVKVENTPKDKVETKGSIPIGDNGPVKPTTPSFTDLNGNNAKSNGNVSPISPYFKIRANLGNDENAKASSSVETVDDLLDATIIAPEFRNTTPKSTDTNADVTVDPVLYEIDENDIDANGVYSVPLGTEVIEEITSPNIKKIIFPEGVTTIIGSSINCPNLESIELPSTLEEIHPYAFANSKLTADNISGVHNFEIGNDCFSKEVTQQYVTNQYQQMMDSLDNFDINNLESFRNNYDRIISCLSDSQSDSLTNKLMEFLTTKNNGVEIGQQLLTDSLNNNEIIDQLLLQYLCYKECQKYQLDYQPVIFSAYNAKIATARTDGRIDCSYNAVIQRAQNITDQSVEHMNAYIMSVVSHELQHFAQKASGKRGISTDSNIFDRLNHVDSILQPTSSTYDSGYGYANFHDLSPDEITADVNAYDSVMENIKNNDDIKSPDKYIEYLMKMRTDRINKAYGIDESGNVTISDFRLHAYDTLLSREHLTSEERAKVSNIKEEYLQIKSEAKALGIDITDPKYIGNLESVESPTFENYDVETVDDLLNATNIAPEFRSGNSMPSFDNPKIKVVDVSAIQTNNSLLGSRGFDVNQTYNGYDYVIRPNGNITEVINNLHSDNNILIEVLSLSEIDRSIIDSIPDNVEIRIIGGYTADYMNTLKSPNQTQQRQQATYTKAELLQIMEQIENFEQGIDPNWSDVQKAQYAYDYLKEHITYVSEPGSTNSRGKQFDGLMSLVVGESTCIGFAYTYKELLNLMGIECSLISGKLNGEGQHGYNVVSIAGKTFLVDTVREMLKNSDGTTGFGVVNYQEYIPRGANAHLQEGINVTNDNVFDVVNLFNNSNMDFTKITNMNVDQLFSKLFEGNGNYGIDQGLFTDLRHKDPALYKEIKNKLIHQYGFRRIDVARFMSIVDAVGACNFAAEANAIVGLFKNNPDVFEGIFGFPLYKKNSNGKLYLNDTEILADLYIWGNTKSKDAILFKTDTNGKITFNEDAIKYDDVGNISMVMQRGGGIIEDYINDYLQSKNPDLSVSLERIIQSNEGFLNEKNIKNIIIDSKNNGKEIVMVCGPKNNTPVIFVDTLTNNKYSVDGGHWVFVTDVTDHGVFVSSWGKRCFVSFEELQSHAGFDFYSLNLVN